MNESLTTGAEILVVDDERASLEATGKPPFRRSGNLPPT
jgi:hypothetical protein